MSPERLQTLIETYGADLRRWPDIERTAARVLLEQGAPELSRLLAEAALLDDWLDHHTVDAPDDDLVRRLVASGDAARPATRALVTPGRRKTWWWPGAGLAGIGLVGSVVGALTVSVALRSVAPPVVDWLERGTAFSGVPADWSEE